MKRKLLVTLGVASLALLALLAAACGPKAEAPAAKAKYGDVTFIRMSGASIGSQTYLFASIIASHWTAELGIPTTALIIGEAKALPMYDTRELEFGYAITSTAYQAYNNIEDWKGKQVKNIRSLINMTYLPWIFAVRSDSKIEKIPDLINKRIARGEVGTGAEYYPRIFMETGYGITNDKVKAGGGVVLHMSYSDMRDKLADGSVDVISYMAPAFIKSPYVLPVEEKAGVRLLPLEPEAVKKIQAKYPYIEYIEVEGGIYKLHPKPVPAMGSSAIYTARADLPDNLVYDMMASLIKNRKVYQKNLVNFPKFGEKEVMFRGLKESGIPLHPGAAKWYQDNGYAIPAGIEVKPWK